ncbi:MAG: hypothetical protein HY698_04475 [Deltaproteobacteria bacterium]|nr:hypothetical protein [Deltaproteobacteria bacterium]
MTKHVTNHGLPLVLSFVLGCGSGTPPGPLPIDSSGTRADASPNSGRVDGSPSARTLSQCTGRPFTKRSPGGWKNLGSRIVAQGEPAHAGEDFLGPLGTPPVIRGRFLYGTLQMALKDEPVRVFLDDCGGWKNVGEVNTDGDGRIEVVVDRGLPLGVYEVRMEVVGDASSAPAYLWVLPKGTHLAVFDIDGTLTTDDGELIQQVLADVFSGSYVPKAYPGAVALTDAHRGIGHVELYMTGRPYWLTSKTREWLSEHEFAMGPLRLAGSNAEAFPSESGVGKYKLEYLKSLLEAGFVLDLAYGNATTDIYAYREAGISPELTWIIGKNAGEDGTNAVKDSWEPRVSEVNALPSVNQPFDW